MNRTDTNTFWLKGSPTTTTCYACFQTHVDGVDVLAVIGATGLVDRRGMPRDEARKLYADLRAAGWFEIDADTEGIDVWRLRAIAHD